MKGTTEYRESYCWFYGGRDSSPDRYDDLIRSKIDGTYVPKENQPPVPEFSFEKRQREEQARIIPDPSNVISADVGKDPSSRKNVSKLQKKRHTDKQAKQSRQSKRSLDKSCFHCYGQGNTNPPNKDLFMTTFNVRAPTGVNPHTLMKAQIRPYVMTEYARPKPVASVKMHKPAFYRSIKEAPKEEQLHMDGPFWIHWPSKDPFPEAYASLEKIVRPKAE